MSQSEGFLDLFIQANRMYPTLTGNIFTFDHVTKRVKVLKKAERSSKILCLVFFCAGVCYTGRIGYERGSGSYLRGSQEIITIVERTLMAVMTIVVANHFLQRISKSESISRFLNGLMDIEQHFICGHTPKSVGKTKVIKLFCLLNEKLVVPGLPVLVAVACALRPRAPLNILSSCFQEVLPRTPLEDLMRWEPVTWQNLISLSVIPLINYLFWINMHKAGFCLALDVLLGPISITSAIAIHKCTMVQALRSTPGKPNLNDHLLQRTLTSFKALQLLTDHFNYFARYSLIFLFAACCTGEVTGAWILITVITPHANMGTSFPLKCFFAVVMMDTTLVIMLVYGFAADLYHQSSKVQSFLVTYPKIKRNGYLRRCFQSFRVLRIQFGMTNFVDKATPLIMEEFSVQRIIDLLLLSKRH